MLQALTIQHSLFSVECFYFSLYRFDEPALVLDFQIQFRHCLRLFGCRQLLVWCHTGEQWILAVLRAGSPGLDVQIDVPSWQVPSQDLTCTGT